jgi:glycine dehydrogenase subunit 2
MAPTRRPRCSAAAWCARFPTKSDGDIDVEALKAVLGPKTAGIMLTNPSTIGVFERNIIEISKLVHEAGGLLYYDGANLNAILGKVRPGDMGFDAIHMNLHKTFSTPHGGGGPGAGAVGVSERLRPFLPVPLVFKEGDSYRQAMHADRPQSIGQLSAFGGNAGVLIRAYVYARLLGREGMRRVGEYATLNANYLAARLRDKGFDLAYPSAAPRTSSSSPCSGRRRRTASPRSTSPSRCSTTASTRRPTISRCWCPSAC